ncbi:MAG: hydrogenase small subunit [Thermoanaerobaculaceae bacterium]
MKISRRSFLEYAGASATVLGLSQSDLLRLGEALANPAAPNVLWLQGAACTGCSVSLLNRISGTAPKTVADVLVSSVNLVYHPNLMSLAGDSAVAEVERVYNGGGYILAVEGGIPTAFGGAPCWAWTRNGQDVTFKDAITSLAGRASKILCVGTCAAWGGIPAAPPNPLGVVGVKGLTGRSTLNIAGCPPHPDWIVWAIAQLLIGATIQVDSFGRPRALYGSKFHERCPRKEEEEAHSFGEEGLCLKELGCRGPETFSVCHEQRFNGGVNWCIGANAPCMGCTQPTFPGTKAFYKHPEVGG